MSKPPDPSRSPFEAVVVGVSSGGMEVLFTILTSLTADFPLPIIIVQHMHAESDNYLAKSLNENCQLSVQEAGEKEKIEAGTVYIAPPNYHLLIEEDRTFSLAVTERVNFARPSIDVLFDSAVDVYGERLIGIILTGANHDGCQGLKRVKDSGGVAMVQDPVTAEVSSMPVTALTLTTVDYILSPDRIGPALAKIAAGCDYV